MIKSWRPRPMDQELQACQRYYSKTYPIDTVPGTNGAQGYQNGYPPGTPSNVYTAMSFPVRMRTSPTVVLYSYAGTSAKVATVGGVDTGTAVVVGGTTDLKYPYVASDAAFVAANIYIWQSTHTAEL